MNALLEICKNPLIYTPACCWTAAQVIKFFLLAVVQHKPLHTLLHGGGMPSSHTATVTGLTTATWLTYGGGGFEFPMALFFSIIVVYDALNVRRQCGREGAMLNRIARSSADPYYANAEPFREEMGHTLPEVAAGLVAGLIVAIVLHSLIR